MTKWCNSCAFYEKRISVKNLFSGIIGYSDPDADGYCNLLCRKVKGFGSCDKFVEVPNSSNSNYKH